MSAETQLRALLIADPAVAALVGDRVSADRIEQGASRPFVVFVRTATDRVRGLDGTLHGVKATFDVQVWADTRQAATDVSDAVQDALETDYHYVITRDSGADADLDIEMSSLVVDFWE